MTRNVHLAGMGLLLTLLLLVPAAAEDPLPADIAAMHPEGKWKIRKRDFYVYLAAYNAANPLAKIGLEDYLRQRIVQAEAARHKVTVTDKDVDRWVQKLDAQVREQSGGAWNLETVMKHKGMSEPELLRRARVAILREAVARRIFMQKDSSWPADRELPEDNVVLVIDNLYAAASKELDAANLPDGTVARIGKIDVTEYEWGRELSYHLPATEVGRALEQMILAEQANVRLGGDAPPSEEELAAQWEWFLNFERNRLARQVPAGRRITDEMVLEWLKSRGLTKEMVLENASFRAEARARGHFRRSVDDAAVRAYYERNKARYGDQLRVQRILVQARGQRVLAPGKKILSLEQGKALADAIWIQATQGADFAKLAREKSDDPDVIKEAGGVVPIWITAATTGYEDTFAHADALEVGGISKPWFSAGRGYVIAKLLERREASEFEELRTAIRDDAAEQQYRIWKTQAVRDVRKSETLLEDR